MDSGFLATDVRRADPDRYLLSLFAPRAVRPALWALYLLNHEISRTRASVTDTRLGLIRLQWWRDEIAKIYAGPGCGQIPILSTLAPVIRAQNIPQDWFDTLIYAHEFDLEDIAPLNMDGLLKYADFTTTPLTKISLKIIGEEDAEDVIQKISQNSAIVQIIRGVPLMLSHRQCLLPQDLLVRENLTPQKIIDFNHQKEIAEIAKDVVSCVAPYRKPNSQFLRKMQRMTNIYLKQLGKNNFDVFCAELRLPPPFLALRLLCP